MPTSTRIRLSDEFAAVERFTPTGPPDAELEWFFTMAESDMGARSNFAVVPGEPLDGTPESRAEAARARRTILGWLAEVGNPHAGVLQAAYAARAWPLALREALGRSTGVVVRLGSSEVGLPDDEDERAKVDLRTARGLAETLGHQGREALKPLELRGRILLRAAFLAYERERGGYARPPLRGIS